MKIKQILESRTYFVRRTNKCFSIKDLINLKYRDEFLLIEIIFSLPNFGSKNYKKKYIISELL